MLPSIWKTGGYELQALKNEMMLEDQAHADELNKAMIWQDQVKKEYKTALKFIEPSARHCLVVPSTNNEGRAVDEWNKWTTLHMM